MGERTIYTDGHGGSDGSEATPAQGTAQYEQTRQLRRPRPAEAQSSKESRRRIPLSVKAGIAVAALTLVAGASPKNTFPHEKGGDVPVVGDVLDGIYDQSGDLPVVGELIGSTRWLYEHKNDIERVVNTAEEFREGVDDRVGDVRDQANETRDDIDNTVDRLPSEVPEVNQNQIPDGIEEHIPGIG
jgi:hypothetical protein